MSDDFLRLIPIEPTLMPSAAARQRAVQLLQRALPLADDVSSEATERVRFVDCAGNFESVSCPHCGADLGEWWALAMEVAFEQQFRDLR